MVHPPKWLWQREGWPNFIYDEKTVGAAINGARLAQGKLLGKAESVGGEELSLAERDLWASEAIATSAIEGETLNLDVVRSSVARRLGIEATLVCATPRSVEGLLDVMEDAAARWDNALTEIRLYRWQAALFPDGYSTLRIVETGRYRTHAEPMQIVSGPIGKEVVHYEAPPSAAVRAEMNQLIDWFNRSRFSERLQIDGIVRAGLIHLWFETIHPFEDGNGRVGRALIDMALAQDTRRATRIHGLSTALQKKQQGYYQALNTAQRSDVDITPWLLWFIESFREACQTSAALFDDAIARAQFWAEHKSVALNIRQRKALNKMLEAGPGRFEGGMTPRKYQSLTGTTGITATRDLAALADAQLLLRRGAGRSTYYDLAIAGWGWQS